MWSFEQFYLKHKTQSGAKKSTSLSDSNNEDWLEREKYYFKQFERNWELTVFRFAKQRAKIAFRVSYCLPLVG